MEGDNGIPGIRPTASLFSCPCQSNKETPAAATHHLADALDAHCRPNHQHYRRPRTSSSPMAVGADTSPLGQTDMCAITYVLYISNS